MSGRAGPTGDVAALLTAGVSLSDTSITVADAIDPRYPLVYVNSAFESMTGYTAAQAVGRDCRFLQGPATQPDDADRMSAAFRAAQPAQLLLLSYRADGATWWNEMHLSPIHSVTGTLTHFLGIQHDVTSRVNADEHATQASRHDPLTGLSNRLAFLDQLERDLTRAHRDQRALAVLFLDVDDFKTVNDTYGHAAGDVVLTEIASRLQDRLRGEDLAGRQGGDEFLVMLVDLPGDGEQAATGVLSELALSLSEPVAIAGTEHRTRISIGMSLFPRDGKTSTELISAADRDMYRLKNQRRQAHLDTR